jgi:D-glycero-alpha-D-manno-heptose-7-phosphate kinase
MAHRIVRVNAVAPVRVCDIGGWTDTWFAGSGSVLNIAVTPCVEVQVDATEEPDGERVRVTLENYGDSYEFDPTTSRYDKHPLVEAAIALMGVPGGTRFCVNIYSSVPPGASTGTSAAVSVAIIGALGLLQGKRLAPYEVANLAHSVETDRLGLQSGIQDQLASAYGGICYIQMHGYPHASVSQLNLTEEVWLELERRLTLVYIGQPHSSHEVHERVIARLGAGAANDPRLVALRALASDAKAALYRGDFAAFGKAMDANTDVQRSLDEHLVGAMAERVMAVGRSHGAVGCKVNGAGGDGGSVTLLCNGDMVAKRKMLQEISAAGFRIIPLTLSPQGLRVWSQSAT